MTLFSPDLNGMSNFQTKEDKFKLGELHGLNIIIMKKN